MLDLASKAAMKPLIIPLVERALQSFAGVCPFCPTIVFQGLTKDVIAWRVSVTVFVAGSLDFLWPNYFVINWIYSIFSKIRFECTK